MRKSINLMMGAFAAFMLFACGEVTPDPVKTKVSVTEGTADVTELTFNVTSENAESCAWMCVEKGKALPTGADIMSKGKSVFANTSVSATATGLKDNTIYVIIAAAMAEDNIVTSSPVEMTTLVKPAEPSAVLSNGSVEADTYTFTITPSDAQKCAYKVYAKGSAASVADVLSTGTEVSATEATTVTVENLEDGEYFVVAAAQNGDIKTLSSKLEFLINTAIPSYTINPTKVGRSYMGNNGKDHVVRFYFVDNVGNTSNIALNFVLSQSSDYVPAGTYPLGDSEASAPKLDSEYTEQIIYNGENGTFVSGSCIVVIKDGKYTFNINLLRSEDHSDYPGMMFTLNWTGDVEDMPIV
ncbi:MAG: hypothetical protein IKL91_06550 [Bacteroidales bacterium]|nr:hypothetical protein [Bacteroidales bacterium]